MTGETQMLTIRVPLAPRKLPSGRKLVLTPEGNAIEAPSNVDITLVKALARAFRWRRMIETGRHATVAELAAAEKINPSYVSQTGCRWGGGVGSHPLAAAAAIQLYFVQWIAHELSSEAPIRIAQLAFCLRHGHRRSSFHLCHLPLSRQHPSSDHWRMRLARLRTVIQGLATIIPTAENENK